MASSAFRVVSAAFILAVSGAWSTCALGAELNPSADKVVRVNDAEKKKSDAPIPNKVKSLPDCPIPAKLIRLPLVRQATDYTCGIGALESVLAYYGIETREDELAKLLKSDPKNGTAYQRIAKHAQEQGCEVRIIKNMTMQELKSFLDRQVPVICLVQAWGDDPSQYERGWKNGHYVVAAGYDEKNIYLMDPSTLGNFAYVPIESFLKRWHDTDGKERLFNFGMVISRDHVVFTPDVCKPME